MENISKILDYNKFFTQILGKNTVGDLIYAMCFFVILFVIVEVILKLLKKRKNKITNNKTGKRREIFLLSLLCNFPRWMIIFFELYISLKYLVLDENFQKILHVIFLFIITLFLIKACINFLLFTMDKVFHKDRTAKNTMETIIKVIVRIIGMFAFLTNIGINLTPILTGFGIAGIAVAFALQSILTDLFSSFSILLSKPFIVGDSVKIGEGSTEKFGTVKKITLKSTTITTIQGQDIIIPNGTVLSTEIINYRMMKYRRQRISIGVTYDTGFKKLKMIPEIIKNVVSSKENVKFEWCYLESMGDFSINFLMSYIIENPDYEEGLKMNEKIYLDLVENFEKEKIEFAFPSQTIYLKK